MVNLTDFAYLDAGTGSIIVQAVIGIAAGVTVFGRKAIVSVADKTKKILKKPAKSEKESSDDDNKPAESK